MLAELDERIEQLIVIGQVEITGQHEVAAEPVALAQERVAIIDAALPAGSVAQVAEQQFAGKFSILFDPGRIVHSIRICIKRLGERAEHMLMHPRNRIFIRRKRAEDKWLARLNISFNNDRACAVLPPVMLFFHQQIEAVDCKIRGTVFFDVILKRLQKPDRGDAAFMPNPITHIPYTPWFRIKLN